MKKNLLIISGGIEAIPAINLAKKMNLYVVVSDGNPKAVGCNIADDYIIASTYDVEETLAAAKKYHSTVRPLDGVMCVASDVPLTVASVADALSLPGISIDSAKLACDKMAMKLKFSSDGVKVPWFSYVNSVKHLKTLVSERDCKFVLKPVDSRGARGVLQIKKGFDLEWAYNVSLSFSPTNRVMIEEFLPGPQVSTESIMLDGKAYTVGFSDRNYEYLEYYAPYIIENGGELPSKLPQDIQGKVRKLVEKSAISMGVTNGVVKGDVVVHEGETCIIELAARLSGGYFCTHEIPLNTGVDFVGAAIKLALGEKPKLLDLEPKYNKGVVQRYFFPEPGIVDSITGIEEVSDLDYVELLNVYVKKGDIVQDIQNHPGRAGVVIVTGVDRDEALERAIEITKTIRINTVSAM